jgi:hypothetical protein
LRYPVKGWGVALVIFSISVFSLNISWIDVGGNPLRMKLTPFGLLLIDSINGKVILTDENERTEIGEFSFPVWADICCGGVYVTDIKGSKVVLWRNGKTEKSVYVPKPEMIKHKDRKIFVSDGNKILVFDENLKKLRTIEFPSKSVYFDVENDKLVHLEYWADHPDITVIDMNSNERYSYDFGLKRPFRYIHMGGKIVIQDFMGKVVIISGVDRKILNVGNFSYGLTNDGKKLYLSSLIESKITVINLENFLIRKFNVPSPVGSIGYCCGYLVACGVFEDEVYILKDEKLVKTIRGCDCPLMVESDSSYVYVLCSDNGKVLKLDFSR